MLLQRRANRNLLNQRKYRVGCSEKTWWEIGAHKRNLHKWKKEEIIHRAWKDLRSYWCTVSCKLWQSNPFFGLYFCFLCNSSSSKDLEQISLEWLSQIQKSGKKNLTGKTAFSLCTYLNRQKYGHGLFNTGHQSYHLTLGQIQYTNSGFFFQFSTEKSLNK